MTRPGQRRVALTVAEPSLPLYAWGPDASGSPLEAAEQDLCRLMRELGEARIVLIERDREHSQRTRKMLLSLADIIDSFDDVFRNVESRPEQVTPQMKTWIGNFKAVKRRVERLMTTQCVVPIENLEQGFDPQWHEVAETVEDASREDGTIVEEQRRGYLWEGQVLRPTSVVVVRNGR